jgi:hypothetical protein
MAIPALLMAGQVGYQLYQAHQQAQAAKKLKQSNYVPSAVNEAITSAKIDSNASSPMYRRGLEKIGQSTARTLDAAKRIGGSSSSLQQSVTDADAREKEVLKDLEVSDASFRAQSKQNLQGLLMKKGQFQQQSKDAYDSAKSALIGASKQNVFNAITTGAEGAMNLLPDSQFTPKNPKARTGARTNTGALTNDASNGGLTPEMLREFLGIGGRRKNGFVSAGY